MLIKSACIFVLTIISLDLRADQDLYIEKVGEKYLYYSMARDFRRVGSKTFLKTPFGSVWKLFIYAYIKENNLNFSPYQCQGYFKEEIFCCKKGQSIGIDYSLINSCGLYFSPYRLKISSRNWRKFWRQQGLSYSWLIDLKKIKPDTQLPVLELLSSLEVIRNLPEAKNQLDKILLEVVLKGTAKNSLSDLGSLGRFKTFTWDDYSEIKSLVGGIAGWRSDGVVFWASGKGKSSDFLDRVSGNLGNFWSVRNQVQSDQCVSVRYFHDYSIAKIVDLSTGKSVNSGSLNGNYEVIFKTGRMARISSNEDLFVRAKNSKIFVDGEMGINEYVARVIDREISPRFKSAAEAFSVVIRSYLFERAKKLNGCFHVIDSSRFQRVSANIPSANAFKISKKTSNLILKNVSSVTYHLDKEGKNKISWLKAKGLDLLGENFKEILMAFYPNSSIGFYSDKYSHSCKKIELANKWLKIRSKLWHRQLVRRPGYERPDKFKVCLLNQGAPFTNKSTHEIFVHGFDGLENQFSIAHEYLHLAFKYHPIGNNEREIDKIAKNLVKIF